MDELDIYFTLCLFYIEDFEIFIKIFLIPVKDCDFEVGIHPEGKLGKNIGKLTLNGLINSAVF